MSIATEISRLQTAKADLKTSIENKGVTVPSATTLDGYAALVDQISGGGITTTEVANATGTTLEIISSGSGGGTTVNVGFTGAATNPKICYIDANGTYHSEGASVDSSTYTYYWSASVLENSVVIIFYDAAYSGAQYANLYQEELISLGYRANWTGALFMRAVAQ